MTNPKDVLKLDLLGFWLDYLGLRLGAEVIASCDSSQLVVDSATILTVGTGVRCVDTRTRRLDVRMWQGIHAIDLALSSHRIKMRRAPVSCEALRVHRQNMCSN